MDIQIHTLVDKVMNLERLLSECIPNIQAMQSVGTDTSQGKCNREDSKVKSRNEQIAQRH